jgi:hypothetical protein
MTSTSIVRAIQDGTGNGPVRFLWMSFGVQAAAGPE